MSTFDAHRDYSILETSYILGVTPPTTYKLLNRGDLDGYKAGNSRRITGESIARLRSGNPKRAVTG